MFRFEGAELLVIVVIGGLIVLPFWKIFSKAGFSGWLSLTQIVPGVNLIVLFYVAFAKWPADRELGRSSAGEGHS